MNARHPVETLADRYRQVRGFTERLCEPLAIEDYVVQATADASPTRWHLAHTTWFFETFALSLAEGAHRPFDPRYAFLFNSYYDAVGVRHARARRGTLSRPTVDEVRRYRQDVDQRVLGVLAGACDHDRRDELARVVEIGLHHEQQHQELILTDLLAAFASNPLRPAYRAPRVASSTSEPHAAPLAFHTLEERVREVGRSGGEFCFDNETPRHRALVGPFAIGSRLATNGEWLAFIDAGGYQRADLWLSDGFATAQAEGWSAPAYWEKQGDRWWTTTLEGAHEVDEAAPVVHVSLYEADAFARWSSARLPTEQEWEVAAEGCADEGGAGGNFVESGALRPLPPTSPGHPGRDARPTQMLGDAWEWTASAYLPYPGYRPWGGALGEYNGKFMSGQMVLRGGSCATPRSHIRATYRNFFPPSARWQFSSVRLAKDA